MKHLGNKQVLPAVALALAGIFVSAVQARADSITITITDTGATQSVTVTGTSTVLSVDAISCGPSIFGESCSFDIHNNSSAFAKVVESSLPNVLIFDSGSPAVESDQLITQDGVFLGEVLVGFNSYPAGTTQPCFNTLLGCTTMTETGTLQTAGTIQWTDGSTATIQFVSVPDTSGVATPEPSGLLLLGTGFLCLLGAAGRKWLA